MENNILDFETAKILEGDHIVRGVAANGMVRALAITSRETVQTAMDNQNASPLVAAALGRLMMAAQMMGFLFKSPDELITLMVRGDGPLSALTVTANNRGQVKGFASNPHVWLPMNAKGHFDVGGAIGQGTLTVIRDQPNVEPYTSQVELISGEIGDDLAAYFVMSDQIPTSVGVGVLINPDLHVSQAGGFIIQLMPGYDDETIDKLEANLTGVGSVTDMLSKGMQPTDILNYLLRDMDYMELEMAPVEYHCGCNEERAARIVMALGKEELQDMIEKNEPAEVSCHFCGNRYVFTPDQLQEMLDQSERMAEAPEHEEWSSDL